MKTIKEIIVEEVTHKEFGPMLDSFVSFASDHLGIESLPNVRYKTDDDNFNSFAAYVPSEKTVIVSTKNRHPMDIFRSVAHELVHCKQHEDGEIGNDIAKEGETGSEWENAANAKAGVLCRNWVAKNKDMFGLTSLVEEENNEEQTRAAKRARIYQKLAEMEQGFGDSYWLRPTELDSGNREFGTPELTANYARNTPGQWQDGKFKDVELSGVIKKKKKREKIDKQTYIGNNAVTKLPKSDNVLPTYGSEYSGLTGVSGGTDSSVYFSEEEEIKPKTVRDFLSAIDESGLHDWFKKSRSKKDGKPGWVQVGGRYDGKPCARQPGQTTTPKCRPSKEASEMTPEEKNYAFNKKQREDPNQPQKSGAAKPTMVRTYKKRNKENKKMNEEKDACYHKVKSRYKIWPSAYASGALVKCRKVGAANWGNKSVKEATNINRKKQIIDIDEQFTKFMEDIAELNSYKREEDMNDLAHGTYSESGYRESEKPRDRFMRILNELDKESMKCNSPKAAPHRDKSHVVKACFDGKEKIIRFGQRGVRGSPKKEGESESYRKRRKSFKARHRKNIQKGKMSAAYWANKVKW